MGAPREGIGPHGPSAPAHLLAAPGGPGRHGSPPKEICEFRAAYIFASGHAPSEALAGPNCHGTVAENTISAGNAPDREAKFALCTRHSDLLWLLGYHGELRDGSSGHATRSPPPGQTDGRGPPHPRAKS